MVGTREAVNRYPAHEGQPKWTESGEPEG